MTSSVYYGIKDADTNYSFDEAKWITPYEVISQLKYPTRALQDSNLIYPNELILNEFKQIVDVLLLAKYRNKAGNIKLKSVLLSHLNSQYGASNSLEIETTNLLILKLPRNSYFWQDVDANLIPKSSLRAGYDQKTRQFSYIGRMKVSSLMSPVCHIPLRNNEAKHVKNTTSNTITDLIGTLAHFYEYIPAIVLQLHDLSYLDESKLLSQSVSHGLGLGNRNESFWKRLRAAVVSNKSSKDMDFNFISNKYEVLCLAKQPATLKQKCILKLNEISEYFFAKNYREQFQLFGTLPNSIRNLLWPSYLMPGQCIVKNSKMRSSNGAYEININLEGSLKLVKYTNDSPVLSRAIVTYEKNLESLLVIQTGVYLIYDNNQAMRKPTVLYSHDYKKPVSQNENETFDKSFGSSFLLELSDSGILRVIVQTFTKNLCLDGQFQSYKSNSKIVPILNLNDSFRPPERVPIMAPDQENAQDKKGNSSIDFNIRIILNDFKKFPQKLWNIILEMIKTIFVNLRPVQSIRN